VTALHLWRRTCALAVGLVLLSGASGAALVTEAGPVNPSQWPSSQGLQPSLEGWANALRIWGPDRYQTSLATSLSLRGNGGFPFDTPDPSSNGAPNLASAAGWWGVGQCPRSVLIVAGDSPADALAATALSDATGQSQEPYFQRSAAADPLFDPVGGFSRVNTDYAPILVTASARRGATTLSIATRVAVQDLRNGGCNTARQAVIVGGPSAVHPDVENELLSLGIDEVFRVQGGNRFATAAAVAAGLGTQPVPSGVASCDDPSVIDGDARMSFYANSVVEWRPSPTQCHLLGRSVVLVDGLNGADALAAGWWTSFWQVPVLLHNGSNSLPAETVTALQSLEVSNLIVLGGSTRIPTAVVDQAVGLTGAVATRVAGLDRYSTSVEMAQQFGGWWPTGRGDEYAGSMVCIAASSGGGSGALGWADTLGAGAWCGAASGAAANPRTPTRALAPATGATPTIADVPDRPGHDAVPIILVPATKAELPYSVFRFFTAAYEPADSWCSSVSAPAGCAAPGFAVVFGGETMVSEEIVSRVSALVSGGTSSSIQPTAANLDGVFSTELPMSPIYREAGSGQLKACVPRGGLDEARWLGVGVDQNPAISASFDIMMALWHLNDADEVKRGTGQSGPGCLRFDPGSAQTAWMRAVNLDGRSSAATEFAVHIERRVSLTGPIAATIPLAMSGMDSEFDPSFGGESVVEFFTTSPPVGVSSKGLLSLVDSAGLTITLRRGVDIGLVAADTFTATWSISSTAGSLYGKASGEALFVNGIWKLRGNARVDGGSMPGVGGIGGFMAEWTVDGPGMTDDTVNWRFDAATP
jgi:hypothetical protein